MVPLPNDARAAKARARFRNAGFAVVLNHNPRQLRRKTARECDLQQVAIGLKVIGRIEEHDICLETFAGEGTQGFEDILLDDATSRRDDAELGVVPDQPARARRAFNEHRLPRTAAQRFNTDSARTSKDIQHDCAIHSGAENVEQRFFKSIAGRTETRPGRPQ